MNNPTVIDGEPVSQRNRAQNLWPGYIVENHGSYSPHYDQSGFVYAARDAVCFVLTGQDIPQVLLKQPNGEGLYRTIRTLASSAGMSTWPMVNDRFHLYGRDVLPITGRYLLDGDAFAGRAEQMLAQHLIPYIDYTPSGYLTKFSGQGDYEPEAGPKLAWPTCYTTTAASCQAAMSRRFPRLSSSLPAPRPMTGVRAPAWPLSRHPPPPRSLSPSPVS